MTSPSDLAGQPDSIQMQQLSDAALSPRKSVAADLDRQNSFTDLLQQRLLTPAGATRSKIATNKSKPTTTAPHHADIGLPLPGCPDTFAAPAAVVSVLPPIWRDCAALHQTLGGAASTPASRSMRLEVHEIGDSPIVLNIHWIHEGCLSLTIEVPAQLALVPTAAHQHMLQQVFAQHHFQLKSIEWKVFTKAQKREDLSSQQEDEHAT